MHHPSRLECGKHFHDQRTLPSTKGFRLTKKNPRVYNPATRTAHVRQRFSFLPRSRQSSARRSQWRAWIRSPPSLHTLKRMRKVVVRATLSASFVTIPWKMTPRFANCNVAICFMPTALRNGSPPVEVSVLHANARSGSLQ